MEIPVRNRIDADLEIGISSLQNPSLISQILAVSGSGLDQLYCQRYNFVTWGALIFALLASFTTIINRFKILFIKIRSHRRSLCYQPLLNGDDFDDSDSDTSCSSDDDEEVEEEDEDEIFVGQNSNFSIKRCRNGKSVMKFWDNLAGFNFSSDNLISLYDSVSFNGNATTSSFGGGVSLGAWDTRAASKIIAEWMPKKHDLLERVNIAGLRGAHKFFVTDDVKSKLTAAVVGGMRKFNSSLANLTEVDGMDNDEWWDTGVEGTESVTRL
jgi:hypothetical protein